MPVQYLQAMRGLQMAEKPYPTADPPLCARCAAELKPGTGSFYQVNIEAIADPTPPDVADEDLAGDIREQIEQLLARMQDLSPQEAMDQVYRRLTLYLCVPCYRQWIEDPAG